MLSGAFYKDKRASLVLVLVWLTIIASKREHFQTELIQAPLQITPKKQLDIVSITAVVEGEKTPNNGYIPENTFTDLKRQIESTINKDLTLFRIGLELKTNSFIKKTYFIPLREESAKIKMEC